MAHFVVTSVHLQMICGTLGAPPHVRSIGKIGVYVRWIDNGVLNLCFNVVFNCGKGKYIDRFKNGDCGRWTWSPLQIVGCISVILSARTVTGIYAVRFWWRLIATVIFATWKTVDTCSSNWYNARCRYIGSTRALWWLGSSNLPLDRGSTSPLFFTLIIHCGNTGVCNPWVVQWTQQTTTVGVLCSCNPTPLTIKEQEERRGWDGWRRRGEGREMVNVCILYRNIAMWCSCWCVCTALFCLVHCDILVCVALFCFPAPPVCDWCSCHPRTLFMWVDHNGVGGTYLDFVHTSHYMSIHPQGYRQIPKVAQ